MTIKQLNTITETNIFEGKTPAVVKLSRKLSYMVTISHEGYHSIETPVEYKGMSGWIWGNIVFGGIIGCIIDGVDGAAANLGPEEIKVELVLTKISTPSKPAEVVVHSPNLGAASGTNAVPTKVQ